MAICSTHHEPPTNAQLSDTKCESQSVSDGDTRTQHEPAYHHSIHVNLRAVSSCHTTPRTAPSLGCIRHNRLLRGPAVVSRDTFGFVHQPIPPDPARSIRRL